MLLSNGMQAFVGEEKAFIGDAGHDRELMEVHQADIF